VTADPDAATRSVPGTPPAAASAAACGEAVRSRCAGGRRACAGSSSRSPLDRRGCRRRSGLLLLPGTAAVQHGRAVALGARDIGLGVPVPMTQGGEAPNEPGQILVMLDVGAIFMAPRSRSVASSGSRRSSGASRRSVCPRPHTFSARSSSSACSRCCSRRSSCSSPYRARGGVHGP